MNKRCIVRVVDNSGAITASIIGNLGNTSKNMKLGDIVSVAIQSTIPNSKFVDRKSKSKSKFSALVVATVKGSRFACGFTKFNYNAVILLGKDIKGRSLIPIGSEILTPIDGSLFQTIEKSNCKMNLDSIRKILITANSTRVSMKANDDTMKTNYDNGGKNVA